MLHPCRCKRVVHGTRCRVCPRNRWLKSLGLQACHNRWFGSRCVACVGVRPTSCVAESLVCVTENLYKQAEQFCNDFESELSAALKKSAYANAILEVIYKVPLLLSSSLLWQCRAMIAWWQEMLNPCTGKCNNKCCSKCSNGERQHAKLIERGKACPAMHSLPVQVPAQM